MKMLAQAAPRGAIPDQRRLRHPVWVAVGRSSAALRRALTFGRELAEADGTDLFVVMPPLRFVSSGLAHAYDVPVGDLLQDAELAVETVEALTRKIAPGARVLVEQRGSAPVPLRGATVVVAGPVRRFLETAEQRQARRLAALGYRVIFLRL